MTLLMTTWLALIGQASAGAQIAPSFGPKRYARESGPPNTVSDTFAHCGAGQQCQLVVVNGNPDGSGRVSSASILLNGIPIVSPADFNASKARIVKPIVLAGTNQLAVTLASEPGRFLTVEVECAAAPAILSAGNPGNLLGATLLTALPVNNNGTEAARDVTATAITLSGGTLVTPVVPFNLGSIAAGGSIVLSAAFSGTFTPRADEILSVSGTYSVGPATYCFALSRHFTVPPTTPGAAPAGQVTVGPNSVSGGRFPHQPLNFPDSVNTSRWTIPAVGTARFQTNPSGLRVGIDGAPATATPFTVTLSSGPHMIATERTQPGLAGTLYVFRGWSDGGPVSHQITAGSASATYTATFATCYLLTTRVSPAGSGTVVLTPPPSEPGGYYESGTKVTVTAQPDASYAFDSFAGARSGTANPQTITLTSPSSLVAHFTVRRRRLR